MNSLELVVHAVTFGTSRTICMHPRTITHEHMTEKAVKINEKLKTRGKELHEVSHEEFDDIAHEVGLKRVKPH